MGTVNYPAETTELIPSWLVELPGLNIICFPDIPLLKYQQYQPRIKALCEKYGPPYHQENVFRRFKKMMAIAVGKTSMKRMLILR
jgi:hypothetical protein